MRLPRLPLLISLAALLGPHAALAQSAPTRAINQITNVQLLPGGGVEIDCAQQPNFTTLSLQAPPRLVLDFPDTVLLDKPHELAGMGALRSVKTESFRSDTGNVARVVLVLDRDAETDLQAAPNHALRVTVAPARAAVVALAPRPDVKARVEPRLEPKPEPKIDSKAELAAAQARAEADAKAQARADTADRARAEAQARADRESQAKDALVASSRAKADQESQARAAAEAKAKAAEERLAQLEAQTQAEARARTQAEADARAQKQAREDAEARVAQQTAEAEAARQAARQKDAQLLAQSKQTEDARSQAKRAEADARRADEARLRQQAELQAQREAAQQAKDRLAAEEARQKQDAVASQQAAERARLADRAEQARSRAAAETSVHAQEEARARAAAEARAEQAQLAQQRAIDLEAQQAPTGPSAPAPNGLRTIGVPTYQPTATGSRLIISAGDDAHFELNEGSVPTTLLLDFDNARLGQRAGPRSLDFRRTPGVLAVVTGLEDRSSRRVRYQIQLKEPVPYAARQDGEQIVVDFRH